MQYLCQQQQQCMYGYDDDEIVYNPEFILIKIKLFEMKKKVFVFFRCFSLKKSTFNLKFNRFFILFVSFLNRKKINYSKQTK